MSYMQTAEYLESTDKSYKLIWIDHRRFLAAGWQHVLTCLRSRFAAELQTRNRFEASPS